VANWGGEDADDGVEHAFHRVFKSGARHAGGSVPTDGHAAVAPGRALGAGDDVRTSRHDAPRPPKPGRVHHIHRSCLGTKRHQEAVFAAFVESSPSRTTLRKKGGLAQSVDRES